MIIDNYFYGHLKTEGFDGRVENFSFSPVLTLCFFEHGSAAVFIFPVFRVGNIDLQLLAADNVPGGILNIKED